MGKNNSKKSGVIGMIVGAIAGVIAGVFAIAPKSAKENREGARKAAKKFKTEATARLKKAEVELDEYITVVQEKAKEARGKSKAEWEKLETKAKEIQAKAREALDAEDDEAADSMSDATRQLIATIKKKLK